MMPIVGITFWAGSSPNAHSLSLARAHPSFISIDLPCGHHLTTQSNDKKIVYRECIPLSVDVTPTTVIGCNTVYDKQGISIHMGNSPKRLFAFYLQAD